MNFRDVELLSAYLDGRLGPSDAARLEARLASDGNLKATLEDLRETRSVLRRLPQRRAPRNFRLTPQMAGVRPPEPRAYPVFRLATAVATFLFLASVAVNALAPVASRSLAAAPAPSYGMGGGGGGGGNGSPEPPAAAAPAATEAPLQPPFAAAMPTATLAGTQAADTATNQAIQTQDAAALAAGSGPSAEASKAAPVQPPGPPNAGQQPVPITLVATLGVLMVVCGAAAWLLRRNNERRIRRQWHQK